MSIPWFKIHAAELLSDEKFEAWSLEQRGAWLTLIARAWREGSIPADQDRIARLLGMDGTANAVAFRSLWAAIGDRFVAHPDAPGRLTSPRLEREREEAEALIEKKSQAGKKGANSRWAKRNLPGQTPVVPDGAANATALPPHDSANGLTQRNGTERKQQQETPLAGSFASLPPETSPAPARYPHARPAMLAYKDRLGALRGGFASEPRLPPGEKLVRFDAACAALTPDVAGSIMAEEAHDRIERGALTAPPVSLAYFLDWLEEQAAAAKREPPPPRSEKQVSPGCFIED